MKEEKKKKRSKEPGTILFGEQLEWTAPVLCMQVKRRPKADFMESMQQDINPTMRGILVDWLVEVMLFSIVL